MAHISHPETGDRIDVEITARESHYQDEMVRVEPTGNASLPPGESEWFFVEEVGGVGDE